MSDTAQTATGGPVTEERNDRLDVGVKWIMLIYFCSGVCSLIDEVVWVRLLKLTLGNTVYASSIVVSMFMAGLALGALVMSRYADRTTRPLRIYAFLEVIATVSALSLPWLLRVADGAYRWYFARMNPSPTHLLVVQAAVSAGILLLPAMVMGSTLPLLGRYVTTLQQRVGRLVGRLYALNTFGATVGCFLAGFVLIKAFGVMGALYIAAAVNLLVALGGWVLSRSHDAKPAPPEEPLAPPSAEPAGLTRYAGRKQYVLMLAFFLSGLVSIGYELIWMRSIIFMLGGFTYVFSAVLTIYLLGNVIGAWIGSRLSKRLTNPAVGFGISLACLGLLGVFYIPWMVTWNGSIASHVAAALSGLLSRPGAKATFGPMLHSTALFLAPALTMGIGFPLALQAWSNFRHKVGQTTGTVYAVNTIGAVLGGVVTGFVLIPLLGVQLSIIVLGLGAIWLGVAMVQLFAVDIAVRQRIGCVVVAVVLTMMAVRIPPQLFTYQFIGSKGRKLLAVKEGVTTTVSVHQNTQGLRMLATSGIKVAGDARGVFRIPQKMLGHFGILLNSNTAQVLSVGYGAGETTACMSLHDLDRIECVEISPELVEMALKFFSHINLGDKLHEKVNMIYMDAKNYLHVTDNRYDLIVNDCINPKLFAGNASLYTIEYLRDALDHLNPGGMFATYLPVTEMPISCTNSVLGTICEVFPYVTVWFPTTAPSGYDFWYVVGSSQPQMFSPRYIDEQLSKQAVRKSAGLMNLVNSHYVLSCYIGDQDDLRRYLTNYTVNSDYRPFVEFASDDNEPRLVKKKWFAEFLAKVRRGGIGKHIDWTGMLPDQRDKWIQEHKAFYTASTWLLKSRVQENLLWQLANSYEALAAVPDHPGLIQQTDMALAQIFVRLGRGLPVDVAMSEVDKALATAPEFGAGWVVKSWALQATGRMDEALDAAGKALQYLPGSVHVQDNMGRLLVNLGRIDEAVEHYRKAIELMPDKAPLYFSLGALYAKQDRLDEAISEFRKGLAIEPLNARSHYYLGELLESKGQPDQAVAQYRKALDINPDLEGAREKLAAAPAESGGLR